MKYKTLLITLCKDEQDIIPFCIDYWKRIADKVIVFDNHSTDNSIALLSSENFIEIRSFDSKGQNDFIQKKIKEQAYNEYKNDFDIIIICDCDELFYFDDFESEIDKMIAGRYNILACPLYSLCEDFRPEYDSSKLLHQLCHKYYNQRLNHLPKMDRYSKLSIFYPKRIDSLSMSVGQHNVNVKPSNQVLFSDNGFCLHIDKGFGLEYKYNIRKKMNENLSNENRNSGLCKEYAVSYNTLKDEYIRNQGNCFDINEKVG